MIKRHFSICTAVCAAFLLFIISCTLIPVEKTWSVNGNATFKGTPSHDVKIAGFLIQRGDVFSIDCVIVSNISNLDIDGGSFSLDMDVEEHAVISGDRVVLIFWEDSIPNWMYDDGERFEYAEPLPGCPVFKDAVSCLFFYADKQDNVLLCAKGWNVDHGNLMSISISNAILSYAKIINWYSWD